MLIISAARHFWHKWNTICHVLVNSRAQRSSKPRWKVSYCNICSCRHEEFGMSNITSGYYPGNVTIFIRRQPVKNQMCLLQRTDNQLASQTSWPARILQIRMYGKADWTNYNNGPPCCVTNPPPVKLHAPGCCEVAKKYHPYYFSENGTASLLFEPETRRTPTRKYACDGAMLA